MPQHCPLASPAFPNTYRSPCAERSRVVEIASWSVVPAGFFCCTAVAAASCLSGRVIHGAGPADAWHSSGGEQKYWAIQRGRSCATFSVEQNNEAILSL